MRQSATERMFRVGTIYTQTKRKKKRKKTKPCLQKLTPHITTLGWVSQVTTCRVIIMPLLFISNSFSDKNNIHSAALSELPLNCGLLLSLSSSHPPPLSSARTTHHNNNSTTTLLYFTAAAPNLHNRKQQRVCVCVCEKRERERERERE